MRKITEESFFHSIDWLKNETWLAQESNFRPDSGYRYDYPDRPVCIEKFNGGRMEKVSYTLTTVTIFNVTK